MQPEVRVGLSGWSYPRWRGSFYPIGLSAAEQLGYVAQQFPTVEINNSFYRLLRPATYQRWASLVPADFQFAVKGSRYITHMTRLRSRQALANFFASGVLALGCKLGPLLWQLPSSLHYERESLQEFLAMLPTSSAAAAKLASEHDDRLDGRAWVHADGDTPLRHALEPRHESFRDGEVAQLLRQHGVALVVADTAGEFAEFDTETADFCYVRLHGETELYTSGYEQAALRRWIRRVAAWHDRGLDVFVYFDNDAQVRAPVDAANLQRLWREHG